MKRINSLVVKLLICLVLSFIVILRFLVLNKGIDETKFREYMIEENIKIISSIEKVSIENDNIIINGYAFMQDKEAEKSEVSVLLRGIETNKEVWLKVNQINRKDVNLYYSGDNDYSNSGFIASSKYNEINSNETYEIIVNIDYIEKKNNVNQRTRKTISTKRYILNGNLYTYNPNEFDVPDLNLESKLLNEVFSHGHLCLYNKEAGMYIYKYENKLYWVATMDFEFSEDGSSYIFYNLYSSQNNKLPEERIQYRFDNLTFIFEEKEFKDESTTPYRVATYDIPTEYPITYINTGVYDYKNKTAVWTMKFFLDNVIKAD